MNDDDDDVVSHANLHNIIPPKIYTSCMYLPYTINNAIYQITFSILYLPTEMWTYVKFRVDKLNRLDKISSYNVCIHVHICLYIIYTYRTCSASCVHCTSDIWNEFRLYDLKQCHSLLTHFLRYRLLLFLRKPWHELLVCGCISRRRALSWTIFFYYVLISRKHGRG